MPRQFCFPTRRQANRNQKYTYGTRGTPTTDALAAAIDDLEGSAGTIIVPSGLAAVTTPLFAFLSAGDHLLITNSRLLPDPALRRHHSGQARRRRSVL